MHIYIYNCYIDVVYIVYSCLSKTMVFKNSKPYFLYQRMFLIRMQSSNHFLSLLQNTRLCMFTICLISFFMKLMVLTSWDHSRSLQEFQISLWHNYGPHWRSGAPFHDDLLQTSLWSGRAPSGPCGIASSWKTTDIEWFWAMGDEMTKTTRRKTTTPSKRSPHGPVQLSHPRRSNNPFILRSDYIYIYIYVGISLYVHIYIYILIVKYLSLIYISIIRPNKADKSEGYIYIIYIYI